ncbi:MAG: glycosyltransferase family 1 protein [Deltaproteobacteria bacterium]|nr:MAG: glycosyltransferase family 1 protein [Deltaproteobacteria bacterium]
MTDHTSLSARRTVAVVHPYLRWGGSEACALWAIEALKKDYDVTLITGGGADLIEKNRFYGTNIQPDEIHCEVISPALVFRKIRGFHAIRDFKLVRYCQKNADRFDVMFSLYNSICFGKKGIQYILDPTFNSEWLNRIAGDPSGIKGFFYKDTPLRKLYLWIGDRLTGSSLEEIQGNLTIVDSDWTASAVKTFLGISAETVYPPVPQEFPQTNWAEREDGFICLGRINYEKRIGDIIVILEKVRALGRNIHLHIIGTIGDQRYLQSLKPLITKNKDWVFLNTNVSNQEKTQLLVSHKYGIHGRANEPFGIAVAEMVRAGCLVWVPGGGGQVEIVAHADLTYSNIEEAAHKVNSVMMDEPRQDMLRGHLKQRMLQFSTDRYAEGIRKTVERFIEEN